MGIGFSFRAKVKSDEKIMRSLNQMCASLGYSLKQESNQIIINFCQNGDLRLRFIKKLFGTILLEGDCQTNIAGPGFHAAAINFVDKLAETDKIRITIEDETDYYKNRDFNKLRYEHFYKWIDMLFGHVTNEINDNKTDTMCICWAFDKYIPLDKKGTIVTPMGRFDVAILKEKLDKKQLETVAKDFFIWNNPDKDGRFYLNSALNIMWEDCCFMPGSRSGEDRSINDLIINYLEKAITMDNTLPFPKAEYLKLCELNEKTPINVKSLNDYNSTCPIGYRKETIHIKIGNTTIYIPGHFLYLYDDGKILFYDESENSRSILISSFNILKGALKFNMDAVKNAVEEPEIFTVGEGKCCAAYMGEGIGSNGTKYYCINAQIIYNLQMTLITISFTDASQKEWAMELLHNCDAK